MDWNSIINSHVGDLGLSGFMALAFFYGLYTGKIRFGSDYDLVRKENEELKDQVRINNTKTADKLDRLEEQERREREGK